MSGASGLLSSSDHPIHPTAKWSPLVRAAIPISTNWVHTILPTSWSFIYVLFPREDDPSIYRPIRLFLIQSDRLGSKTIPANPCPTHDHPRSEPCFCVRRTVAFRGGGRQRGGESGCSPQCNCPPCCRSHTSHVLQWCVLVTKRHGEVLRTISGSTTIPSYQTRHTSHIAIWAVRTTDIVSLGCLDPYVFPPTLTRSSCLVSFAFPIRRPPF